MAPVNKKYLSIAKNILFFAESVSSMQEGPFEYLRPVFQLI